MATQLIVASNTEELKYSYKDQQIPTLSTIINRNTGAIQYLYSGYLTFINDADAQKFKDSIFTQIKSADVAYALIYYLGNTHHYTNPLPDVVLEKIEFGDCHAVFNNILC